MIGLRVLGPLEVTVNGAPAEVGGPRQRCVLARLIAEQGRAVSADRLIEDLYADEAPPRALATLQSFVSHLRRALEPGRPPRAPAQVLVTSPPGYALRLGRDAVDAWSFEDAVHQAAALDDAAAVDVRLSAALASWRGGAYQEFAGLPWAELEASRLDELRLTAVERHAEAALRLGRAGQIVAGLDRLTAEHPLREEGWRLLALALYQCGRQGDALAAMRRARARLAEDLGVDPGPTLRELEDDILAQAPRLSAAPATRPRPFHEAAPAAGRTAGSAQPAANPAAPAKPIAGLAEPATGRDLAAEPPYVGRDAELGEVIGSAARAAAGSLAIVLVAGDAGSGKSALAGVVSQHLAARGWTVTAGQCPEDEGAPAGWAWAQVLQGLARAVPPEDPGALAALLGETPAPEGDVPAARFRQHRAVGSYLSAVSQRAPLLVVLDDLHRADGETLALLAGVTADLAAARTVVLATYRPAEAGERLAGCLAALAAREPARITLGGLDPAAARALIRATCTRPVDEPTAQAIVERTGGNPFFIREAARLLDSEGTLAAITEVPAGVREVLRLRIARLPATAQTILRQAAVLGTETDVEVLGEVAGVEDHVLLDAIEAGLFTALVTEPAAGRIRFAHALVRDTLYDELSRLRRSRLHARAAAAIERHHPGDVTALAHHYAAAGTDPARAARYARLAAAQAEQRFAYHQAARLWEQAVAALNQVGDAPARQRLELVLGLVGALAHTGELARARSRRRDAVRAALPLGDPDLLARVITAFDVPTLWPTQEYGLTDRELVGMVEQTLPRLPPGDRPRRCRLLVTLAFELDGAESERGYQASAEAVEMARRLGDPETLAMALNGRDVQSFRHDGLAERRSLGAELLALPGKPVTAEALAHLILMRADSGAGEFAAADRHADEAAQIARRYDLPVIATRVSFYRALRVALSGDLPAADARYRQAAAEMGRLGMWQHGAALATLGGLCLRVMEGRTEEIAGDMQSFYGYRPWHGLFSELYALTLAAGGHADQARAVAARPRPIRRDAFWLFMTGLRGLLAVAIDDRERAEPAYRALLPYADRPAGADTGAITLWPAAQILGDLARYLRLPGADGHYRQALTVGQRAGVPLWAEAAGRCLP